MGVFALVLSGHDQGPYLPHTLSRELGPSSVRTVGCLDVGFALNERDGAALLDLHVGNRCTHPEALDIRRLAMRGVDEQGEARTLALYDPREEIGRFHVGGSEKGRERLRLQIYREGRLESLGAETLSRLCFDLGAIADDSPEARPAPLCFQRRGPSWSPTRAGET